MAPIPDLERLVRAQDGGGPPSRAPEYAGCGTACAARHAEERQRRGIPGQSRTRSSPLYVRLTASAEEESVRFVSAAGTRLRVVEGGQHFLSASKPDDVNAAAVEFANRWTSRRWCVVGGVSRIM